MDRIAAIPLELRERAQWVNWSYATDDKGKPTKQPRNPHNGNVCDITNPSNYSDFDTAINNAMQHDCGVGFVLTQNDPYAVIDLDDPVGKAAPMDIDRIYKIGNDLMTDANSYIETSPSGKGVHIWMRADIPPNGVRSSADCIELYSTARFMTVTGNSIGAPKPIRDCTELAGVLHGALDRASKPLHEVTEKQCDKTVEQVINEIAGWQNAPRFWELANTPFGVGDDSSIDQGVMNFFVQATQNVELSRQCFEVTPRAKRDKWSNRRDYQDRTIRRAFDAIVKGGPALDLTNFIAQGKEQLANMRQANEIAAQEAYAPEPETVVEVTQDNNVSFNEVGFINGPGCFRNPGGLLGAIMDYFYRSAYRPIPEVALAGALGVMSGVCGRAFNAGGLGLNLYVVLLAASGVGKNAAMQSPKHLIDMVAGRNKSFTGFIGDRHASAQALVKSFGRKKSFCSFFDEFGEMFEKMSNAPDNPHLAAMLGPMMELYTASGKKGSLPAMLHSKSDDSSKEVKAPAFSFVGASVPTTFYEALSPRMGTKGLTSRLTIINYEGGTVAPNDKANLISPPDQLLERLFTVCSIADQINERFPHQPQEVEFNDVAEMLWREFRSYCDAQVNATKETDYISVLWSRCAEKARKLAGLVAVGYNPYVPVASLDNVRWAIDFSLHDAQHIIGKFESGEVGVADNEDERFNEVRKGVVNWLALPADKIERLNERVQYVRAIGCFPKNWLFIQIGKRAAFKTYRKGLATNTEAFDATLKALIGLGFVRMVTGKNYPTGAPITTPIYEVCDPGWLRRS